VGLKHYPNSFALFVGRKKPVLTRRFFFAGRPDKFHDVENFFAS